MCGASQVQGNFENIGDHDTVPTLGLSTLRNQSFLSTAPLYVIPTDEKVYSKHSWEQLWFRDVLLYGRHSEGLAAAVPPPPSIYSQ